MDPANTANILGSGSAQVVLAICVVVLTLTVWGLGKVLLHSYQDRLKDQRETITQQSADARVIAETVRDFTRTMDVAIAQLRRAP